ncbi:MAG: hypothetical protein RRY76_02245, partial [Clostridia bacterium]
MADDGAQLGVLKIDVALRTAADS